MDTWFTFKGSILQGVYLEDIFRRLIFRRANVPGNVYFERLIFHVYFERLIKSGLLCGTLILRKTFGQWTRMILIASSTRFLPHIWRFTAFALFYLRTSLQFVRMSRAKEFCVVLVGFK